MKEWEQGKWVKEKRVGVCGGFIFRYLGEITF